MWYVGSAFGAGGTSPPGGAAACCDPAQIHICRNTQEVLADYAKSQSGRVPALTADDLVLLIDELEGRSMRGRACSGQAAALVRELYR